MNGIFELPLSWAWTSRETSFHSTPLGAGKAQFIYSADINHDWTLDRVVESIFHTFDDGFVLKGCNEVISQKFIECGAKTVCFGKAAVIDLVNFNASASLRELSTRGGRNLSIIELPQNIARKQLQELIAISKYQTAPRLKYLFRDNIGELERTFVAVSPEDELSAMVSISPYSSTGYHCEMLLRNNNAPAGTMELLIHNLAEQLKREGTKQLNLGEVPYPESGGSLLEKIGHLSLRTLSPSFSSRGLFNFKNKFQPNWQPVMYCGWPNLGIGDFARLAQKTNCISLAKHNLGNVFGLNRA